ncbi:hypothetical protein GLOTRDRAFT_20464, partial [Gloeophyllum trabeum ATCC 11539]
LSGYHIPGVADKILITLFADDATIYLPTTDRLEDLQDILTIWCKASGAKFNTEKTEILPIGNEEHRTNVIVSRKLHQDDAPLPESIHVVKDGETIRSLGAWIGNKANPVVPWERTLDKVNRAFKRLQKGHPTLNSKRHMVQHMAGGMTQYLTKVQGMPDPIIDSLVKLIRNFIWEDAPQPPLALERLYLRMEEGGIN